MTKNKMGGNLVAHSKITRRSLLGSGAAIGLLGACSDLPSDLTRQDRSPIEGGIGGTGIVGLVTDFGSLIVNGLKVETNGRTRYSDANGRMSGSAVGLADSLTIEATTRQGRLLAKRVHVTHPLIGRIQAVAGFGAALLVNGVVVQVEPQARGRAAPGDRVRISGLWRGNTVVASQVIRTTAETDVIAGEVSAASGTISIGGTQIFTGGFGSGVDDGQFATITGKFSGSILNASRITPNRFIGAAGELKRLSIEGYLDPANTAPGFKVSGLGHSFAENLELSPFQSTRTLFDGPYTGKFEATRGLILPNSYQSRRSFLQTRLDGDDLENWTPTT